MFTDSTWTCLNADRIFEWYLFLMVNGQKGYHGGFSFYALKRFGRLYLTISSDYQAIGIDYLMVLEFKNKKKSSSIL